MGYISLTDMSYELFSSYAVNRVYDFVAFADVDELSNELRQQSPID